MTSLLQFLRLRMHRVRDQAGVVELFEIDPRAASEGEVGARDPAAAEVYGDPPGEGVAVAIRTAQLWDAGL